jgi:hypothetical protein
MALVREAFEPVPVLTASPLRAEWRIVGAPARVAARAAALIDWCVERAVHRSAPPAEVQDIPIL